MGSSQSRFFIQVSEDFPDHRRVFRGLVKRIPGEHDGRVLMVALTHSGIELIDRAIAVRFADASYSFKALSLEDRELLA